jgi:hypothetical protein
MVNNLEEAPRCYKCGCSNFERVHLDRDHFIVEFKCEHKTRMGFLHSGQKLDNCPFCSGYGFQPHPLLVEVVCEYCKDSWQ